MDPSLLGVSRVRSLGPPSGGEMEHVGAPCASLTQAMKTGSSRLLATTYVASYGEGPTFIPYTSEAHGTQRRPALAVRAHQTD